MAATAPINLVASSLSPPVITKWTTKWTPNALWLSQLPDRTYPFLKLKSASSEQKEEAASIHKKISKGWHHLVAGSEGFLTDSKHRTLYRQPVAWGEQVSLLEHCRRNGHVNNVTYLRYAESSRVNWFANFAEHDVSEFRKKAWNELVSARGTGVIIRSVKLDFKFPLKWPDQITVYHKLRASPEPKHDSMILDVLMFSQNHRRPVARAEEDIVLYDYLKSSKVTFEMLPSFMLEKFRERFRLQGRSRRQNLILSRRIEERIVALEEGSSKGDEAEVHTPDMQ